MSPLLLTLEVLGVFANALAGMLEARRKNMDLVGMYVAALVTAFGGGTLRDVLLDRRPFFWVQHQEYPLTIFVLCVLAVYTRHRVMRWVDVRALEVIDALGLGLFAASGTSIALEVGSPPFIASLMGVITAVFGGVLRDVIGNDIPRIFQRSQLYATCAFVGAWMYLGVYIAGGEPLTALLLGLATTFVLRLLALRRNWTLPG